MACHPSKLSDSRAIAYLRVSTEEQDLGPEAQRSAIQRWAVSCGVVVVAWHEDRVSGAAPLDKRPALAMALSDLAKLEAGCLVVAKRDRLARDPIVAAMVEGAAGRSGARVVSAAGEGTGSDDPTSILMRRIVDAFAEYERLMIKARTSAALAVKAGRGERVGSVPFGFHVGADDRTLETDHEEQRALSILRGLRADGLSHRAIADQMNADNVQARGSRWHPTTVARMLARAA